MNLKRSDLESLLTQAQASGNTELATQLTELLKSPSPSFALVPTKPTPGLLNSMCMRYRHDFGLDKPEREDGTFFGSGMTERERESLRGTMSQLHEEVVGTGFYSAVLEAAYTTTLLADTAAVKKTVANAKPV